MKCIILYFIKNKSQLIFGFNDCVPLGVNPCYEKSKKRIASFSAKSVEYPYGNASNRICPRHYRFHGHCQNARNPRVHQRTESYMGASVALAV